MPLAPQLNNIEITNSELILRKSGGRTQYPKFGRYKREGYDKNAFYVGNQSN